MSQITIMIPYVFEGITQDYIKSIIDQLQLGKISSIDLRPVGDHQQAFIHIDDVNTLNDTVIAINEGNTIEVTYDAQGHYWKMVKYTRKRTTPSPDARARGYQMLKEREQRETQVISASIQRNLDKMIEEIVAEQDHLADVTSGAAEYNISATAEEKTEKVQPVMDALATALLRETPMTAEEKSALVRKFADMMCYL